MTTVEKPGNPTAEDPAVFVKRMFETVASIDSQFEDASDATLLNLSKDPKVKEAREGYNKAIALNKFMIGDEINQDAYDSVKGLINEPYKVSFYTVTEDRKDKEGNKVQVEVKKCKNLTVKDLNVRIVGETMEPENIKETNKKILSHTSIMENAQSKKMTLNGQIKMARSIAHGRQSDAIEARDRSIHEIWQEVTRKEKAKEQGIEYKEIIPETSVLFEEPILAGFL